VCRASQSVKARFVTKDGRPDFEPEASLQLSLILLARDGTLEECIASLINNAHET